MRQKAFSVRDAKTESWSPPFFQQTAAQALRGFQDEVNSGTESSMIAKHPEDFALYEVGAFDLLTGKLEGCQAIEIACGVNLKRELRVS